MNEQDNNNIIKIEVKTITRREVVTNDDKCDTHTHKLMIKNKKYIKKLKKFTLLFTEKKY